MFQLVRSLSSIKLAVRQLVVFGVSFVLASLFYKFGNFALEAIAFLATWLVLDAVVEGVRAVGQRLRPAESGKSEAL